MFNYFLIYYLLGIGRAFLPFAFREKRIEFRRLFTDYFIKTLLMLIFFMPLMWPIFLWRDIRKVV